MERKQFYVLIMAILMAIQFTPIAFAEWKETEISRYVPLPRKITVVPPSPDLPKEIAAFSGRWEGIWETGSLPTILIVEEINLKEAKIIHAWGKAVYFPADYERSKVKVIGKEIQFTAKGCQFKFIMSEDLKTIRGTRDCPGGGISSSITMKKIE